MLWRSSVKVGVPERVRYQVMSIPPSLGALLLGVWEGNNIHSADGPQPQEGRYEGERKAAVT